MAYDLLCSRPEDTMRQICSFLDFLDMPIFFLDRPVFAHDCDNLDCQAEAFDSQMLTKGLQTMRRKVGCEKCRPTCSNHS